MVEVDLTGLDKLPEAIKYRDYNGAVQVLDPKKILALNSDNLPFETQATTYYMVTQLAETASLDTNNKKAELERVRSSLYYSYAMDEKVRKDNGGKKATDAMLNAMVNVSATYQQALKFYNESKYRYNMLNNLMKAFEQRKDLIQSISAKQRVEMSTGQNTITNSDALYQSYSKNYLTNSN